MKGGHDATHRPIPAPHSFTSAPATGSYSFRRKDDTETDTSTSRLTFGCISTTTAIRVAMSRPATPAYQLRRPNLPQGSTSTLAGRSTPTLGRSVISLDEWEAKAPLSDGQLRLVKDVGERLEKRALPAKVSAREEG